MMMNSIVCLLSLGLALTALVASGSPIANVATDRLEYVYDGPRNVPEWAHVGRADENSYVSLIVALTQRNVKQLEEFVLDVSNPYSANFAQKYLTIDDLTKLMAPTVENQQRVLDWLTSDDLVDIRSISANRDLVKVGMPIHVAESLFQTEFHVYSNTHNRKRLVRSVSTYSIPLKLSDAIDFVANVHGFPKDRRPRPSESREQRRLFGTDITPDYIRKVYNISSSFVGELNYTQNRQGVFEMGSQWFSESDLAKFFEELSPVNNGDTVWRIVGENNPSEYVGIESSLDIQYIMAMAPHVASIFYSFSDPPYTTTSYEEEYLALFDWVMNVTSDPQSAIVNSISYGQYGGNYVGSERKRLSTEVQKLGARGISVLLASGDNGVGCSDSAFCGSSATFEPDYPNSPWFTMVGATGTSLFGDEKGASLSAGGASDFWSMPDWQKEVVDRYLQTADDLPESHFYNATSRFYPDVAAWGMSVEIYQDGSKTPVDGTSCAAPIWAGIISTLNDFRLRAGKNTLGFLNQMLYAAGSGNATYVYNDISSADVNSYGCCKGFPGASGWDAVTGLGSPNVGFLLQYVMSLP